MSDVAPPEPRLVYPPLAERWLPWITLASLLVHAGLLAFVLWSPSRATPEAKQPEAVEVELVEPEKVEPHPEAKPADERPSQGRPSEDKPAETPPTTEPPAGKPPEGASKPPAPAETPAGAAAEQAAARAAPTAVAPTPLPRPKAEPAQEETGASSSGEPVAALRAEAEEAEGGVDPNALAAGSGPAALDLGPLRTADRFYLEAMLQQPALARAREMLQTLPRDKRLSQTCNIEALAQIGNAGEGYAPDVVMADAYAPSVLSGNSLSVSAAIFRSREKWYGLAFDCTLSPDLTEVTSFTFRLGADVTETVLERLGKR